MNDAMVSVASKHQLTTMPLGGQFRCSVYGLMLLIVFLVVANAITQRVVVDGGSMSPTMESGDFLLVNRLTASQQSFQRGDVIVFHMPDESPRDYVKRIIGLPGEVVELRQQQVYINGRLLDEPYLMTDCDVARCADGVWQIGKDQYFVMGDNRSFSRDSRAFGPIQSMWITGDVIARYWPFSQLAWIP